MRNPRFDLHLLLLAFFILAGCTHYTPPSDTRRQDSFAPLESARVHGQKLDEYLRQRTAVLVTGQVAIAEVSADGPMLFIRFQPATQKNINGPSHAIAIDHRGYFLTAAHCLEEPCTYVAFYNGQRAHIFTPRIVARAFDRQKKIDAAILHVDAPLQWTFDWSDSITPGSPAAAVGCQSPALFNDTLAIFNQTCFAGQILSTATTTDNTTTIRHNLPLRPGDSGGPLTTPDGKLLGINSYIHIPALGTPADVSTRPDPTWVRRIIEEDQKQPHTPPPHIPETLRERQQAHFVISL